ncbi:MAG: penicillin-binding protein activator [Alphaproteobacteria bacterium]|nr:penicillin-binding protein activator [Alphaproteobacteria bacterium]
MRVRVLACSALLVCALCACGDPRFSDVANVLRPILGQPQPLTPGQQQQVGPAPAAPPPAVPVERVVVAPVPPTPAPAPAGPGRDLTLRLPPLPNGPQLRPPEGGLQPIRIAVVVPLSGPSASLGQGLLNAAMIALFDMGDPRFQLLPRDDEGLPEGAIDAVESALQEGAQLVLGPLFSASVQAAAQVTRAHGVNMIAFSTDREVAGNGVYLIGFTPEQQVERVVTFARSQGLSRFAALVPTSPYGGTIESALRATATRLGSSVIRVERYAPAAQDFAEPVQRLADYRRRRATLDNLRQQNQEDEPARRALNRLEERGAIAEAGFDAVLLAEGGERLRALASLLPFYDVHPDRVRFLGTGLWDEPNVGREPALVGGWFAGPPAGERDQFRARYEKIFGEAPPRLASLAYDATALAAVLARAASGPDFSSQALTNPTGFAGIDGIFRFRADGVAERGLSVIEVRPRGVRVLSPAPDSFQAVTN